MIELRGPILSEPLDSLEFNIIDSLEAIYVSEFIKNLEEIEAPESLSIKEQLRGYLEDFCTNRAKGRVKEDLNRGVPYTEEGETYFRYKDFWKFLERAKWKALEHNKTAHRLKEYFGVEDPDILPFVVDYKCYVTSEGRCISLGGLWNNELESS